MPVRAMSAKPASKPNILFIAIDDLRPEILSFGREGMVTPNLDRLADESLLFERAYCMVPTCGASRASLMTGIRPARDRFTNYKVYASEDAPGITTLNTHLKNNGYYTVSLGKIFHHKDDNEEGWSVPPWRPSGDAYMNPRNKKAADGYKNGMPYEREDFPDTAYRDGATAEKAVEMLREAADRPEPFFMAVGFFKPHLPFIAPEKYWALYDGKVELPDNYYAPENAPEEAMHNWGELRQYTSIPKKGNLPPKQAINLIHGYKACVSFTDAQIGKVLDALEDLGLDDNTIIVLWGDHGWNVGEHTLWCKHCCFENALNAPLLVSAPTLPGFKAGKRTDALTEFIDIYPTLCDLAGIQKPAHLQGKSVTSLLVNPAAAHKEFAISRFQSGDSIRTDRYRYTEYRQQNGDITGRMLYDHRRDPDENVNIVDNPENADLVAHLAQLLNENKGR